ncbi:MAG TPA: hypothetical protein VK742_20130, partial [Candidatus Sulfotelmatobacter sp.]|nr:hypothetical protein [Candidatus Sulfotelmatobacter sp.]
QIRSSRRDSISILLQVPQLKLPPPLKLWRTNWRAIIGRRVATTKNRGYGPVFLRAVSKKSKHLAVAALYERRIGQMPATVIDRRYKIYGNPEQEHCAGA